MLERLIEHGRHIEVQVFADAHGNAIHLGERDCTAQRRRQKVIEEAPSPVVSPAMREAMGRDAVAAALAVGYRGAGTVEFIVDADLKHYFLEMNTRLQVEHPVTECITGLDLVEWQLRIAAGEPLPLRQDEVRIQRPCHRGAAVCRRPVHRLQPADGRIAWWRPQRALQPGVRIDHGIAEGGEVSPYYDAMVAKFIVHGRDRADALRRLGAALEDAPLLGLRNNGRFLRDLLQHPEASASAQMHTTLHRRMGASGRAAAAGARCPSAEAWCLAAAVRALRGGTGQRSAGVAAFDLHLACGDAQRSLRVHPHGRSASRSARRQPPELADCCRTTTANCAYASTACSAAACASTTARRCCWRCDGAQPSSFHEPSPFPADDALADATRARAPGGRRGGAGARGRRATRCVAGQPLVCVEAMKMEMWLHAARRRHA